MIKHDLKTIKLLIIKYGSLKIVAEMLGTYHERLRYYLEKNGYHGHGKRWQILYEFLGYESEREMWYDVYWIKAIPPSKVSSMFGGVNKETIRNRIVACGIKLKSRGGKNHVRRI